MVSPPARRVAAAGRFANLSLQLFLVGPVRANDANQERKLCIVHLDFYVRNTGGLSRVLDGVDQPCFRISGLKVRRRGDGFAKIIIESLALPGTAAEQRGKQSQDDE